MNNDLKEILELICNDAELSQYVDDGDWLNLIDWVEDATDLNFYYYAAAYDLIKYLKEECDIADSKYFDKIIFGEDFHDLLYRDNSRNISWDTYSHEILNGTRVNSSGYISGSSYYVFSTNKENLVKLGADPADIQELDDFVEDHDILFKLKPSYTGGVDDIYLIA